MGMPTLGKSRWRGNYTSPDISGNPDPQNFKIIKTKTIEQNSLIYMNFPDCKNCEGDKILLINGMTAKEVRKLKKIDPHFTEELNISEAFVVCRFHPSNIGWNLGVFMLKYLAGKLKTK